MTRADLVVVADYIAVPAPELHLAIIGRLPGANEIIAAARTHWAKGATQKRATEARLRFVLERALRNAGAPFTAVDVACSWHEGGRGRDPDNVRAGIKFVLDALVRSGWLPYGDGPKRVLSIRDEFEYGVSPALVGVDVWVKERTSHAAIWGNLK
jgi:hypothetical protein